MVLDVIDLVIKYKNAVSLELDDDDGPVGIVNVNGQRVNCGWFFSSGIWMFVEG
jgi:hypothetical protein